MVADGLTSLNVRYRVGLLPRFQSIHLLPVDAGGVPAFTHADAYLLLLTQLLGANAYIESVWLRGPGPDAYLVLPDWNGQQGAGYATQTDEGLSVRLSFFVEGGKRSFHRLYSTSVPPVSLDVGVMEWHTAWSLYLQWFTNNAYTASGRKLGAFDRWTTNQWYGYESWDRESRLTIGRAVAKIRGQ